MTRNECLLDIFCAYYHDGDRRSYVMIVFLLIKRKIMQQEDTSWTISSSGEAPLKNMFSPYAGGESHVSI